MKQKLILFLLYSLFTVGVSAQGVITRQKPTTQQVTPSKPKTTTQPKQKPRSTTQTQTRPQSRPSHTHSVPQGSNKTFTANGVSFTMVYVQGGKFLWVLPASRAAMRKVTRSPLTLSP